MFTKCPLNDSAQALYSLWLFSTATVLFSKLGARINHPTSPPAWLWAMVCKVNRCMQCKGGHCLLYVCVCGSGCVCLFVMCFVVCVFAYKSEP